VEQNDIAIINQFQKFFILSCEMLHTCTCYD